MTGAGPPPWGKAAAKFRAAATGPGRRRLGACALEGTRLFERALRAGVRVWGVLVNQAVLDQPGAREAELLAELAVSGTEVQPVPQPEFAELTGGRSLGGLVGLAALPAEMDLAALPTASGAAGGGYLLGAAGLDDPGNVGALARTAHACGAAGLVLVGCTDPFHPRAVRTSMGSLFRLPVLRRAELGPTLDELRQAGWTNHGAVSEGGVPLPDVVGSSHSAVFVGSEAFGLEPFGLDGFDGLVSIPMPAGVDSFSVNAAAAVLLYGFRNR